MYFLIFLYLQYIQVCNALDALRHRLRMRRLQGRVMAAFWEQDLHRLTQQHPQEKMHE